MSTQSDLIAECNNLAKGGSVDFRWGIWNDNSGNHLTTSEAADCSSYFDVPHRLAHRFTVCKNAWNHDSFAEIVWLIGEISTPLLPTSSFTSL